MREAHCPGCGTNHEIEYPHMAHLANYTARVTCLECGVQFSCNVRVNWHYEYKCEVAG